MGICSYELNKKNIQTLEVYDINFILNSCENCKFYYNCDTVLELNDKLKELEADYDKETF